MIAAFINLTLEWLWLVITWTFIGVPLFAILMTWRLAMDRGWSRRWASIAFAAGTASIIAVVLFFDQYDFYGNLLRSLMFASLFATVLAWTCSVLTTRQGRLWADLIVVVVPTALGFSAWYIE